MAFDGDTVTDTIAAILERIRTGRPSRRTHLALFAGYIQRCLEKDTRQRLRDIGDARVEIEQIIQISGEDIDADIAVHQCTPGAAEPGGLPHWRECTRGCIDRRGVDGAHSARRPRRRTRHTAHGGFSGEERHGAYAQSNHCAVS